MDKEISIPFEFQNLFYVKTSLDNISVIEFNLIQFLSHIQKISEEKEIKYHPSKDTFYKEYDINQIEQNLKDNWKNRNYGYYT